LPARTGRGGKIAVSQPDGHRFERHAHHLGGGLGQNGVGAGADIGHVGFHRQPSIALQPDARRRFRQQIVAEPHRNTHAVQPAPFALLPRFGIALRPAEFFRAGAQAFHQMALGEPALRLGGIDLRVVEDAELDRVHAQRLGHFVHGHFQHHQAGRLAWRAHGIALGQVQRGQLHEGLAMGAA
jgi:hypothetical protein